MPWVKIVFGGALWQYGFWSFQTGYIELERFFHKNQYTLRNFLNFENWTVACKKSDFLNLKIFIFQNRSTLFLDFSKITKNIY
jgi:hypothetical protein